MIQRRAICSLAYLLTHLTRSTARSVVLQKHNAHGKTRPLKNAGNACVRCSRGSSVISTSLRESHAATRERRPLMRHSASCSRPVQSLHGQFSTVSECFDRSVVQATFFSRTRDALCFTSHWVSSLHVCHGIIPSTTCLALSSRPYLLGMPSS